ncbi:MAG: hypothetical protein ACKVJU_03360 [Verrucomicrobiales bacterium]
MDWLHPQLLLLAIPAFLLLVWFDAKSAHPMSEKRRRWLLIVRTLLVLIGLLALASPARVVNSNKQAAIFVMDHSRSEGEEGLQKVYETTAAIRKGLSADVEAGFIAEGRE